MKKICYLPLLLILMSQGFTEELQNIPIGELGWKYQLTGKLQVPLGEVVTVAGVVINGPDKGYEGGPNLRIQKIEDRITQKDIQIVITPFFYKWGEKHLPKLELGATYEMEGYETGEFVGVPAEVFKRGAVVIQTTGHYFRSCFIVTKAKRINPIVYAPYMFKDHEALIQGIAQSRDGKSCLIGNGWSVIVMQNTTWPKHVEGKQIETFGKYKQTSIKNIFKLVDGKWQLVKLEDQINRQVCLRGRAISKNGVWWFEYRGIDLYVENMQKLPGWTIYNHWQPMIINGKLEKCNQQQLGQISIKPEHEEKEYFMIRKASWQPLESLLTPELLLSKYD